MAATVQLPESGGDDTTILLIVPPFHRGRGILSMVKVFNRKGRHGGGDMGTMASQLPKEPRQAVARASSGRATSHGTGTGSAMARSTRRHCRHTARTRRRSPMSGRRRMAFPRRSRGRLDQEHGMTISRG